MATPSRSEVFSRLVDLTDQLISTVSMMAHLHQTESGPNDRKLAIGWLMMGEMFKKVREKIVLMGQGRLH